MIQTDPSRFDERLLSEVYLCRLRLKQGREIQEFISLRQGVPERERERERDFMNKGRSCI